MRYACLIVFASLIHLSGPSFANDDLSAEQVQKRILRVVQQGGLNPDQQLIIKLLGLDPADCARQLESSRYVFDDAPAWLITLSQAVFRGQRLSPEEYASLERFKFQKPFTLLVNGKANRQIDARATAAYRKTQTPLSPRAPMVNVEVQEYTFIHSMRSAVVSLHLPDGETLSVEFKNSELGSSKNAELIADYVVMSLNNRQLLKDPAELERQIDGLKQKLKDLRKIADPRATSVLEQLTPRLNTAYPNFLQRATSSKRSIVGHALATYVETKEVLISLAKMLEEFPSSRAINQQRQAAFKPVLRSVYGPARSSTRNMSSATSPDSDYWATYLWITDPNYMLSHPYFWGAKDDSAMGMWMIFDHLSSQNDRGRSNTPFTNPDVRVPDANQSYTQNPPQAFADPNSSETLRPDQALPLSGDRGQDITWLTPGSAGNADSDSGAWQTFKDATPDPRSEALTPREDDAFKDDSGWTDSGSAVPGS